MLTRYFQDESNGKKSTQIDLKYLSGSEIELCRLFLARKMNLSQIALKLGGVSTDAYLRRGFQPLASRRGKGQFIGKV